jgi:hypothetical protein
MLHILNGESTERTLKQSSVPGVFFSFREVLDHGPTPTGSDEQEWRRIRSALTLNSIDLWLGGVHLSGSGSVWRWNEASEKLEIS